MKNKNPMMVVGTALLASTMLGMSSNAHAAEDSKLTVTDHQTTYYTSKDLKTKRTAEPEKVFRINGTVTIKGNKYYRIYQDKFSGYIRTNQVKPLVAKKTNDKYVVRKDVNVWDNLYWTKKKEVTSKDKLYQVKYIYTLGNGVRYYSLYQTNKDGKSVWCGYTNSQNASPFKAVSMNQKVTVTKDNYTHWKNLYFTQNDGYYTKGQNFEVKRYYDLNGARYYSLYQTNKDGKSVWCGYINNKGVRPLKAIRVEDDHHDDKVEQMAVTKNVPIYKNLYLTQTNGNTQKYVNKVVTVNYKYTFGNGKVYYSISNGDSEQWLGYVSSDSLSNKVPSSLKSAIKQCLDAYNKVEKDVPKAVISSNGQQNLSQSVNNLNAISKNSNATVDDYYDAMMKFSDTLDQCSLNMKPLQDLVTKAEGLVTNASGSVKTNLENAIKEGKNALENAQTVPEYQQYYNAAKALNQAIQAAEKTITTSNASK